MPELQGRHLRSSHLNNTTVHHITTVPGPPVKSRARRLAPDRLAIAKKEFQYLLQQGIIRPLEKQLVVLITYGTKENA